MSKGRSPRLSRSRVNATPAPVAKSHLLPAVGEALHVGEVLHGGRAEGLLLVQAVRAPERAVHARARRRQPPRQLHRPVGGLRRHHGPLRTDSSSSSSAHTSVSVLVLACRTTVSCWRRRPSGPRLVAEHADASWRGAALALFGRCETRNPRPHAPKARPRPGPSAPPQHLAPMDGPQCRSTLNPNPLLPQALAPTTPPRPRPMSGPAPPPGTPARSCRRTRLPPWRRQAAPRTATRRWPAQRPRRAARRPAGNREQGGGARVDGKARRCCPTTHDVAGSAHAYPTLL